MLNGIKDKVNSVTSSIKSVKKIWSNETDHIFQKYASKEDLAEYKRLLTTYGTEAVKKLKEAIYKKNYEQAKKDYQQEVAQLASANRSKAKPKNEYEEWKASQPTKNIEKNWLSSSDNFISKNSDSIIGVSDLLNEATGTSSSSVTSNLTPTVKNLINDIKDDIKNKKPLTEEEKAEIAKRNPKSVSMKIYSFIRDTERFTPYCAEQGYAVKIGFGHIVDSVDPYSSMYPARNEDYLIEEYYTHILEENINEWLQTINPSLIPVNMVYDLFNRDINNIEKIINKELTDVVMTQYEYDALASFLWSMQDEGLIYDEFQPSRLIKELHTLLFYKDDRKISAEYIRDVDKRLIQKSNRWNRRQAEITLFLTGNYEALNAAIIEKYDYESIFSTMKNEYIANKNGDKNLKYFNSFLGNDNLADSVNQCHENNINLYVPFTNGITTSADKTGSGSGSSGGSAIGTEERSKTNTIKKEFSSDDIIGQYLLNNMIYPVLGKVKYFRGGKDSTGINNDNTICYGWFGSERGEGQGIHYGVDLLCEKNNPIILPYSGTIETIGRASEKVNGLQRVVLRPDGNKDVVVSFYYLNTLKVEQGQHYDAGKLLGYSSDCSELFEQVATKANFEPYSYIHVQFNRFNEKGLPLNPTTAIVNAADSEEPQELIDLKETPIVEEAPNPTTKEKTVTVEYPGVYQIILVGSGGYTRMANTHVITDLPVTVDKVYPKYSVLSTNGAYIIANKFLEAKTYDYSYTSVVSSDEEFRGTIFNHELKAENGRQGFPTQDNTRYIASAEYVIPDSYTYIGGSKSNSSFAVSNIGGNDIQTGERVPFMIKSGLSGAYQGYGKGGPMLLNDYPVSEETSPTFSYIKIQYLDWK